MSVSYVSLETIRTGYAVTDGYVSIIIRISVIINARESHNVEILASFIVLLCCLANRMLRIQDSTVLYTRIWFSEMKGVLSVYRIEVVRWQTARREKTLLHLFYCVFLWFGISFHWRSVKSCWDGWHSWDEEWGKSEFDGINFTLRTCKSWVYVYICVCMCWNGMLSNGDGFCFPWFSFGPISIPLWVDVDVIFILFILFLVILSAHCISPSANVQVLILRNYSNKNNIK